MGQYQKIWYQLVQEWKIWAYSIYVRIHVVMLNSSDEDKTAARDEIRKLNEQS